MCFVFETAAIKRYIKSVELRFENIFLFDELVIFMSMKARADIIENTNIHLVTSEICHIGSIHCVAVTTAIRGRAGM